MSFGARAFGVGAFGVGALGSEAPPSPSTGTSYRSRGAAWMLASGAVWVLLFFFRGDSR